jgi:copper chaperone CopZ
VSAAIAALPGIAAVAYDAKEDLFAVSFDPAQTSIEAIFAAVYVAGKQEGQEYLPRVVP